MACPELWDREAVDQDSCHSGQAVAAAFDGHEEELDDQLPFFYDLPLDFEVVHEGLAGAWKPDFRCQWD